MKRGIVFAFAFLLALPAFAAANKGEIVPFTTNGDGLVIIPITLGGATQPRVIVDTGGGLDVFAPSFIGKLKVKPAGQFTIFDMNGDRIDVPLYVVPEIHVGPMVKRNVVVGALEAFDKLHFDGIISMSDFRDQAFTFDFPKKQIVLESDKSLAQRLRVGASVPFKYDDDRGIAVDLFPQVLIGGESGECELDTGSPSSTFSTRYMARLGIAQNTQGVTKRVAEKLAGGTATFYTATVPQLSLAADPPIRQLGPRVEFSNIIYDCVLGIDFWSGRSLTIDIAHNRLIVSREIAASAAERP